MSLTNQEGPVSRTHASTNACGDSLIACVIDLHMSMPLRGVQRLKI
jgi:hypothetical protein